VNQKGRSIIGYDEILEGGLAPNATVMSWQGTQGGIAAAKQKHDVIMMPLTDGMYLDFVQGRSDQEPLTIAGGDGRIEHVYRYDPTPKQLNPELQKHIVGVQAGIWGEYTPTTAKVEYMLLPRLLAVSEVAWTLPIHKNFKDFNEVRLPQHLAQLDKTSASYRVPNPIGAKDTTINVMGAIKINWLVPVKGGRIYYTIDGREPDATTNLYAGELSVSVPAGEMREVKSVVITPSGKKSSILTTTLVNRSAINAVAHPVNAKKGGLQFFYVPGKFQSVTEIDTLDATKAGVSDSITIIKPVIDSLNFAFVFKGYIYIPEPAAYEFSLESDDGSRLYLDDELIINNDGEHYSWERAAAVTLKPGFHKIRLAYFNVMRHSRLNLTMKVNGKKSN
ncbi:MAG: beta-N-acetylhexosaminidase, partial [Pedobacter sp.]